jgi:hypothetical protein
VLFPEEHLAACFLYRSKPLISIRETKGLGCHSIGRLECGCLSIILGFSATAAVTGAGSFWEEPCHSADWPSDEAQMRTICVSISTATFTNVCLWHIASRSRFATAALLSKRTTGTRRFASRSRRVMSALI